MQNGVTRLIVLPLKQRKCVQTLADREVFLCSLEFLVNEGPKSVVVLIHGYEK